MVIAQWHQGQPTSIHKDLSLPTAMSPNCPWFLFSSVLCPQLQPVPGTIPSFRKQLGEVDPQYRRTRRNISPAFSDSLDLRRVAGGVNIWHCLSAGPWIFDNRIPPSREPSSREGGGGARKLNCKPTRIQPVRLRGKTGTQPGPQNPALWSCQGIAL